jgi:hypothetical protein
MLARALGAQVMSRPMAAKKSVSKSEFVMSLPQAMSPQDVVARAQATGLALSVKAVVAIRNLVRANLARKTASPATPKRGPGRPPRAKAPLAVAAKPEAGEVNKAAFVRSLPGSLSAREVVAKAKAQGITLSENHVSTIRSLARVSLAKKTRGAVRTPKRRGRPPGSKNTPRATVAAGFEAQLAELVLEHGLRPLEQALDGIVERLRRSLA